MDKGLKHDLQHKPKEVKVMLDKERTLRLDLNAYAELDLTLAEEEKSFVIVENDFYMGRPYALRYFLWAALIHEDPDLTIEEVGQMITPQNQIDVLEKIYSLVIDDTPKQKTSKKKGTDTKNVEK